MTDRVARDPTAFAEWPADFRAAEDHSLEASLAATPRNAWLGSKRLSHSRGKSEPCRARMKKPL